jgi:hypothetical protein
MYNPHELNFTLAHDVSTVYAYYRALSRGLLELPHVQVTHPDDLHFINSFLKECHLVKFNADGSLGKIRSALPHSAQLQNLLDTFFQNYYLHNLDLVNQSLNRLVSLPTKPKNNKRHLYDFWENPEHLVANPTSNKKYEMKKVENSAKLSYIKNPEQKTSFSVMTCPRPDEKLEFIQQAGPSRPSPRTLSKWSEVQFVRSLRLMYNFYETHDSKNYKAQVLIKIGELQQFTSSTEQEALFDVLIRFNKFLVAGGYITQKRNRLSTIVVTGKPLPSKDPELVKLLPNRTKQVNPALVVPAAASEDASSDNLESKSLISL